MMEKINNLLLKLSRRQKLLFAVAVILVLILIIQSTFTNNRGEKQPNEYQNTFSLNQTTNVTPTKTAPNLYIISTNPANNQTDVSLDEKITIVFNRPIKQGEIDFSLFPDMPAATEINSNKLIATVQKSFEPGMRYSFVIRFPNTSLLSRSFSFTTVGPTKTFLPDTQPSGAAKREEDFQKTNHPDVFLSNKTPFENDYFSIVSEFKLAPTGHFMFKISLKGNYEESKKAAFDWIKSQGLTDAQVGELDIELMTASSL